MTGHRTAEGKLLRNMQDRVTMETHPCEVLRRSPPLQSPWRPWQRTAYSNLAWSFTMATQAGPLWRPPRGHFYGDLRRRLRRPHQSHLWVGGHVRTRRSSPWSGHRPAALPRAKARAGALPGGGSAAVTAAATWDMAGGLCGLGGIRTPGSGLGVCCQVAMLALLLVSPTQTCPQKLMCFPAD